MGDRAKSESSARGYAIVTTGTSHAGSWRAWLGGANSETAEISQSYTVPSTGGTLRYFRATTDSSLISSFYIDDVSVSAALQGVTDPNGMDGEQLTKPEPKPAAPLGVSEER